MSSRYSRCTGIRSTGAFRGHGYGASIAEQKKGGAGVVVIRVVDQAVRRIQNPDFIQY